MSITNITRKVDELGSAWEDFKKLNERRLQEIEKKGSADSLTNNHLSKLNNSIDEFKNRLDNVETVLNRPSFSSEYKSDISSSLATDHKNAFINYVRKGVEGDLSFLEKKALSVGTDADGGYLVTPLMSTQLARKIYETSPMRQVANVTQLSSDVLEIIEDNDEAGANAGAIREVTNFSEGKFKLLTPLTKEISIGDTYQVSVGCDKNFSTCISKFNNAVNFRGEPHIPGTDRVVTV